MQLTSTFFHRGSGRTLSQIAAIALLIVPAIAPASIAIQPVLEGRIVYPPSSAGTAIDADTGRPPVRHQAGSTRRQPRRARVSQSAIESQCRYMALYQGFPYGLCLEKWNNANK